MEGQTYNEEIDCGSFFDQIDDFIEFPPVNDTTLNNSIDCNDFADIWTNNSDELQVSDPIFSDSNPASALSAELSVPVSNHKLGNYFHFSCIFFCKLFRNYDVIYRNLISSVSVQHFFHFSQDFDIFIYLEI